MSDYITELNIFFDKYFENLLSKKIIKNFNKKNINIDYLSKSKKGDVSSNFLLITQKNIIDENFNLKSDIEKNLINIDFINNVEITNNGFINIFLKKNFILEQLDKILIQNNQYGAINIGDKKNVNVEFVSANPTGPVHIAHIRGAIIGDVISSILLKTGYKVTREYYVNDAGSQIVSLGESLFKRYCQLFNSEIKLDKDEYPGEYLISIAKQIMTKDKDKWIDVEIKIRKKYFEEYAVNTLIQNIKDDLSLVDIKFDKYTFESKILNRNLIGDLFKILEDKNLIYEGVLPKPKSDELSDWEPRKQLLFKSSSLLDNNDRAFKKSDGNWTYFANDAAYHYDKYLRKFDKIINIWGADHIGYIPRMKSIILAICNDDHYLEVITCQIVRLLKDGKILKMSKREGNFITLKEVYEAVGKDALRYYMISTRSETSMDFNMDKVIEKNKDNPVFYCQYAYARATSVINKAKEINPKLLDRKYNKSEIINYISDYEFEIFLKLLAYPYLLYQTSINREPHRITNYLEDLCSSFHSFWNMGKDNDSLRMLDENNLAKTKAKIIWLECFKIVLKDAFNLIGIEAPESM